MSRLHHFLKGTEISCHDRVNGTQMYYRLVTVAEEKNLLSQVLETKPISKAKNGYLESKGFKGTTLKCKTSVVNVMF